MRCFAVKFGTLIHFFPIEKKFKLYYSILLNVITKPNREMSETRPSKQNVVLYIFFVQQGQKTDERTDFIQLQRTERLFVFVDDGAR